ncbi:accessory Sec system translocase SecA2 [Pueribacillus theae]|uniref:Protein translocase subunit SecA n=1 Tax=Pueribacillus theae TaxID=2171751 RepID=A0A2U1JLA8_9BACI|nr:accessory Sec system translocase SecA2 [Pueribacillus theae]PWA05764.1 accessory Sec system translocase SecA2 [Pueribacillus theae]
MTRQLLVQRPKNMHELRPYLKLVKQINDLEDTYRQYSDEQLKSKTEQFKQRLANGETIHDLAVEAFATVREASSRVLGLRHFNVQLLSGLVLLHRNVAEMNTGEGKTLVASLPSYLVALEGKGVHIVTVNDYLAKRDKELIGQIHEFLGLTVGLTIADMTNSEKKAAYNCDITYGVGTEFGFDYLRDNLVSSLEEKVQRPYHYALIDEIDSVLIDEAKTPLIIAGKDMPSGRLYKVCAFAIKSLKPDDDYTVDQELKVVNFTEEGIAKCEKVFGIGNLFDLEHSSLFHALLQSLRAHVLYERDVDYIVDDGEIKLIDMNTGRIMEGRSLTDGLHQAIESKEGLENTEENKTFASITIQNYFRMYPSLGGMTGTAKTEEEEFRKVYGMDVVRIPTNKENRRIDYPDLVFLTREGKYRYLVKEVKKRHEKGQPLLIGTTSILRSEEISDLLKEEKLEHVVLNAKSAEQEAEVISLAGQKGRITIATNMAGRGTDIILGEGVAELGGLHVIGTERNESERIDNQLKGRAARQGDPGSSVFIISLEDTLFQRYAAEELERLKPKLKVNGDGLITSPSIHKFVEKIQRISEGFHFQFREYNLKLENVLNQQREVIYEFRNKIISAENVLSFLKKQVETIPVEMIETFCDVEWVLEDLDLEKLAAQLNKVLIFDVSFEEDAFSSVEDIKQAIQPTIDAHFRQLRAFYDDERLQSAVRGVSLYVIDNLWKSHLETMAQFKEGIGIRQYKQEDPVQQFEREGFILFEALFSKIKYRISEHINQFIRELMQQEEEIEQ